MPHTHTHTEPTKDFTHGKQVSSKIVWERDSLFVRYTFVCFLCHWQWFDICCWCLKVFLTPWSGHSLPLVPQETLRTYTDDSSALIPFRLKLISVFQGIKWDLTRLEQRYNSHKRAAHNNARSHCAKHVTKRRDTIATTGLPTTIRDEVCRARESTNELQTLLLHS